MEKLITITVISKSCGIKTSTLRMWEKRYQTFTPKRLKNGQRYYSNDDLIRAKYLAILTQNGHSISLVSGLGLSQLKKLAAVPTDDKKKINDENVNRVQIESEINQKNIIRHLLDFNIEELINNLTYLRNSMGAKEYIFKIILPIMQKVGQHVVDKKCSVTQEHIISTIIRDQLLKIGLPNLSTKSSRVILATAEGNLHELGILFADIICRANRISTFYLGAAHPADSLAEAISALSCPVVILGAVSSDHWNYDKNIVPYLRAIDKKLNHKVIFLLGGGKKIPLPKFKNISEVKFVNSFEAFDEIIQA